MRLTLILGGARSGKSRWALDEARRLGDGRVSWIATADPGGSDEEMARRIARHRTERPESWQTLEAPLDPAPALARAEHDVVVLDCLTVLLANRILGARSEEEAETAGATAVAALLASTFRREGHLLVVANEVGQGVVPTHPLGRWFRDVQGRANQEVAAVAERVVLMVAGLPVPIKR